MTNEDTLLRPSGTKRHGWQGILFYWLCYLGAGFLGLGALIGLLNEGGRGVGVALLLVGVAALNFKDLFTEEGGSSLPNVGIGGEAISADG